MEKELVELLRGSLSRRDPGAGLLASLQDLKEALDAAYEEGSPEAQHRFEKLRETLKEGRDGIGKVIRSLRHLAKKHPRRKPITRVLNFFKNHQHRRRYAEVRARGMPIGSGAVESSNKVLIKTRMKGAGMRWGCTFAME